MSLGMRCIGHAHALHRTHTRTGIGTHVHASTSDTTARVRPSTLFACVGSTSNGKRIMVGVFAFTNTRRIKRSKT
jgi:hypothetical protein